MGNVIMIGRIGVAAVFLLTMGVSTSPVLGQRAIAPGDRTPETVAREHIANTLLLQCTEMGEPLELTIGQCTKAARATDLTNFERAVALRHRGIMNHRLGEFDLAIRDYTLSIDLTPEEGRSYYLKGLVYEEMGEEKRANSQYRNANLYSPDDPDVMAKMAERGLN